ncbi:type I-E CRISPR-associated endonuclease Cas1e [Deinococcus lacus]|uniref:CRISPR-associated endonuclease Cas1 n=1 Tax=Deinococcus lacus TaxID=392561 RepID=A0ABW1YFP2_9DEIO
MTDGNPIIWKRQNLKELPRFSDGTSYLYLEHTVIEQSDRSIQAFHPEGMIEIPCASLGVLLLGPGSSVSHSAMVALSRTGCSVVWVGEQGVRFYAAGVGESSKSHRLMRQARLWANEKSRMRIIRQMYTMRFPEGLPDDLTLQQIRGREGARVKALYSRYGEAYGVKWSQREYDRGNWDKASPSNKAMSAGNACLYGLAHAAILSCGYSPGLGFIHTGKQLSLAFDIADLYKMEIVAPIAFREAGNGGEDIDRRVRLALRDHIRQARLLERMVNDLLTLFDDQYEDDPQEEDVGDLYDPDGDVAGGKNYG